MNISLYESLKNESVAYFIYKIDKELTQKQKDIDKLVRFIKRTNYQLNSIQNAQSELLIQKHTKK